MSENQQVFRVYPLEQLVLHEISKKLRQAFLSKVSEYYLILESSEDSSFIHYEDGIIEQLPIGVNKLMRVKLRDAIVSLRIGYNEAVCWAFRNRHILPFCVLRPDAGQYEVTRFINPFGQFEDLSWAKLFVIDKNQPVWNRFEFACIYCFEDLISSLWHEMKANKQLPCEGDLARIKEQFGSCIGLWAYRMEDKIEEVVTNGFYVEGFTRAVNALHEHAARFFWSGCSAEEKDNILSRLDFRVSSSKLGEIQNVRLVFFLYSLLFVEHKNNLTAWIAEGRLDQNILASLLCSCFGKVILEDLLAVLDSIPTKYLENILVAVASLKYKSLTSAYKEVFKIIWNYRLSQRKPYEIIKFKYLLLHLMENNSMDLLEIVILPLSDSVKEKVLMNCWREIGQLLIHDIFTSGKRDMFCCILLLFLKYNPDERQLTLRVNALNLLDRFIGCYMFFTCMCEFQFSMSGVKKISRILQHFRETLPIIDQLVNHTERKRTNYTEDYRDLLSKEIYPLCVEVEKANNGKMEEDSGEIEYIYSGCNQIIIRMY